MKRFHTWAPPAAIALLVLSAVLPRHPLLVAVSALGLVASVLAAVHHAETVAHRVGELLGTLVLALAVTVIEVALIVSMTVAGGPEASALARDAIFAAVMIICDGVLGVCLFVGALVHREQAFRVEGTGPAFAALVVLSSLSLVLPTFTTSAPGPVYTPGQLGFAAIVSLALWVTFVFVQTVRHPELFRHGAGAADPASAEPVEAGRAWLALGLLLVALVGVVGLAKALAPTIEAGVLAVGAPKAVIGVAISLLVLLPETLSALAAARRNDLQTSLNLALGSALASIGLTIPAVVAVSLALDLPLTLGLDAKSIVLMAVSFLVVAVTLGSGRTSIMQGAVHLVLFAAFLFLSVFP